MLRIGTIECSVLNIFIIPAKAQGIPRRRGGKEMEKGLWNSVCWWTWYSCWDHKKKNTTALVVCSGHVGIEPVNCQLWIGVNGALSHWTIGHSWILGESLSSVVWPQFSLLGSMESPKFVVTQSTLVKLSGSQDTMKTGGWKRDFKADIWLAGVRGRWERVGYD